MRIIYKTASLLDATERYILHGCNAQCVMGSGVAKVLYERYPAVREDYFAMCRHAFSMARPLLGTVGYSVNDPHIVINAITQEFYGSDGKLYVSYDAIESCMYAVNEAAKSKEPPLPGLPLIESVALPLVGAGLAGGSWARISEIIERVSTDFQPVVYLIDGKIPLS